MYHYLFSKLIICDTCKGTYRGIMERKNPCYICTNYSNENSCNRNKITEQLLSEFINKYCRFKHIDYQPNKSFMKSLIKYIVIKKDGYFDIYLNNGDLIYLRKEGVKYV